MSLLFFFTIFFGENDSCYLINVNTDKHYVKYNCNFVNVISVFKLYVLFICIFVYWKLYNSCYFVLVFLTLCYIPILINHFR